jgi:hypothetical protein
MKQQLVFHANNILEALDKAKIAYKESMVTADDNGEKKHKPLSEHNQVIHTIHELSKHTAYEGPTDKEIREKEKQQRFNSIPD